MQAERITFLATPDHRAALDAFVARSGMSVGHVVREATMFASIDHMIETVQETHVHVDRTLRRMGARS